MDRRTFVSSAALLAAVPTTPLAEGATRRGAPDLSDPTEALMALVKLRGDVAGATSAWAWGGTIWSNVPGEPARKLFLYDAF
jgi:hypothetical protein